MKSYGQLCAVARALDVVGDRWTLLIVRELLVSGPLRFTEVQRGLPGVAPTLLTQRLRDLEQHGVVHREPGVRYALTERGAQLEGVLRELLRWGAPTVPDAPADAEFQMHWLSLPVRYLARDADPSAPDATVRFGTPADGFDVTVSAGVVTVTPCRPDHVPAATVDGPGPVLVGLVQGAVDLTRAEAAGITVHGNEDALRRILPSVRVGE